MSEQSQAEFQDFELFHDQTLGIGSYGKVCRAKFGELPCAAKILHPALFQFNDPHCKMILQRFERECELLKMVRHPNVVQYLGVARDPVSHLPVLLMELLDENLTHFLERSDEPLPYHLQLSLWYDIALALAFLHSKDIMHRDLSGNNVLLIAGSRAKVTDFSMSRLTDSMSHMSHRLTQCPGTPAYMSPETLRQPCVYTERLDIFSSGVVAVQILTREYPDPGSGMERQDDPNSPTGVSFTPIAEVERRKNHIDQIDPKHPMLPMIRTCLSDREQDRPSARQLCHQLAILKQAPEFAQSMQQPTPNEQRIQEMQMMQTHITKLRSDKEMLNTQLRECSQELQLKRRELWETRHNLQRKTEELHQKTQLHQEELEYKTKEYQLKTKELQQELQQQSGELQKALQGQLLQESQQKVKELESKVGEMQVKQQGRDDCVKQLLSLHLVVLFMSFSLASHLL